MESASSSATVLLRTAPHRRRIDAFFEDDEGGGAEPARCAFSGAAYLAADADAVGWEEKEKEGEDDNVFALTKCAWGWCVGALGSFSDGWKTGARMRGGGAGLRLAL